MVDPSHAMNAQYVFNAAWDWASHGWSVGMKLWNSGSTGDRKDLQRVGREIVQGFASEKGKVDPKKIEEVFFQATQLIKILLTRSIIIASAFYVLGRYTPFVGPLFNLAFYFTCWIAVETFVINHTTCRKYDFFKGRAIENTPIDKDSFIEHLDECARDILANPFVILLHRTFYATEIKNMSKMMGVLIENEKLAEEKREQKSIVKEWMPRMAKTLW